VTGGLEVGGLVASPGGAPVLRGIDLAVAPGTRTVIVGPSGAGKTTLLRAVAGLEPVVAGSIRLAGRALDGVPPHRRRIAIVFQEPRLLPHLTVTDNVALPLRASGVGRGERRARAGALLEEVGLSALAARRPRGLSGGEQQRVALARALCAEPDLLMLDEPLAALDPNRRESLRRLVVRVQRERRLTTLAITHDRAEAAELGERIALMLEGRIVQHDEPRALFERPVSAAVARFFGATNLVHGADGTTLAIRPEHVRLAPDAPLRAVVTETAYAGTYVRVVLDAGGRVIEAHVPPGESPPAGEAVGVVLPAEHLWPLPERA
jgi:putative spermidine/putrescine transport system ATP-binding protein